MKKWILLLGLLSAGELWAQGHAYQTSFPLTENPISEGGKWQSGSTAGVGCWAATPTAVCWGDIRTQPGLAFGTVINNCQGLNTDCNDSTAILTGTWGPDQTVQGTIFTNAGSACCHEVELHVRMTIGNHSIAGYEINCDVSGNTPNANGYLQLVRWEGPLGQFTGLGSAAQVCVTGDVLKVTVVGSLFTIYKNGVVMFTVNDSQWGTGSPGLGYYTVDTNYNTFGFSNFSASDGGTPPLPPPPAGDQTIQKQLSITISAVSSGLHNVALKWNPVTTCGASNVACTPTGYRVYRTVPGAGYGVPLASATGTTYTDASLAGGQTFHYVVTAYLPACVQGQTTPCGESQYSNEVAAVIP